MQSVQCYPTTVVISYKKIDSGNVYKFERTKRKTLKTEKGKVVVESRYMIWQDIFNKSHLTWNKFKKNVIGKGYKKDFQLSTQK